MPIPGGMLFEAYRQDMLARGCDPHSLATYDRAVRKWLEHLESTGVDAADAKLLDAQTFLVSLPWAATTKKTARAYLSAAYGYAIDYLELLERNPFRRVKLPRPAQRIPRTIPVDELRLIWRGLLSADDRLLFALFAFTGCRTIEVRRLTWHDVDLGSGLLRVQGKREPGQPVKERLVPIHPHLRAQLVARTWAHANAHVAAGRAGDKVSAAGLHYRMKRIRGDGTNHDYRRTVATSLRANGCDPSVRDSILGWSRGSIFERHYNAVSAAELHAGIMRLYADSPL
jgi:integrase